MPNELVPSAHRDVGIYYEADFGICEINITAPDEHGPFSWLIDTGHATIQPDGESWPLVIEAYRHGLRAAVSYFATQTATIEEAMRQQEARHA